MVPYEIAKRGLRACAPMAPEVAYETLRDDADALADTILSSIECAAVIFGQLAHESGEFERLEENLNYSAARMYQIWPNRFDSLAHAETFVGRHEAFANHVYGTRLGNNQPGDGYRFRGSGYIQLTGRENFTKASTALGVDYVNQSRLARSAAHSWRIAAWYLRTRKRGGKSLIALAQAGDVEGVTRGINGGTHGLEARRRRADLARDAMTEAAKPDALPVIDKRKPETVRALQERLRHIGYAPGPVDGIWGPITEDAVRLFQEVEMIHVDGKVGPETRTALDAAAGI